MMKGQVLFLTGNVHKADEVTTILADCGIGVDVLRFEKEEIQADLLEDVSTHSALQAFDLLKRPLIVEDSGLFINRLNMFPGPYTSYVYRTIGCAGILKLMEGKKDRSAEFCSVVTHVRSWIPTVFKGSVQGAIGSDERGKAGFGFDSVFVPSGETMTLAEMPLDKKCRISHRGAAVRRFAEWYTHARSSDNP